MVQLKIGQSSSINTVAKRNGFSVAAVSRSISAQLESLFGQFGQEVDDTIRTFQEKRSLIAIIRHLFSQKIAHLDGPRVC